MTESARVDPNAASLGAGTSYTLLAALGFAAVSTLTSIALAQGVSLSNILTWRYVLGSVVMVAYIGTRHYPRMPWREAARYIALGGGGQALLVGLALSSLRYITAAMLAFLFYTYPAWVTLVQTIRGAERPTSRRLVALGLAFGGVVVMVGMPGRSAIAWQGVALAIGAAMVYGVYIPLMLVLQKTHSVAVTSAYGKIGSAICFLVLAAVGQTFTATMTGTAWAAIIALTLFSTVLPAVFFLMGLMRLGAVRTAIVSTVEPFFTAVLGAVVLRQPITPSILAGGVMIVTAVVILQVRRERVA